MRIDSTSALKCLNLILLFCLVLAWFYAVGINGYLEPASLDAKHFVAGASALPLIVPLSVAVLLLISSFAWIFFDPKVRRSIRAWGFVVIAIVSVVIMPFVPTTVERFAADYSEREFDRLASLYYDGLTVTREDVTKALGKPILSGRQNIIAHHKNQDAWLYSYMPSTGFGWHKRVFYFDGTGKLIDINQMDEP